MFVDFVLNGQGNGPVAEVVAGCRFDPGFLRPYISNRGVPSVTINTGRMQEDMKTGKFSPVYKQMPIRALQERGINSPVFNATSLRKEDWIMLDRAVLREARQRLRAWADLAAANTFGGFNGMSKLILEHETMSDPGEAIQDMDGLTDGRTDNPLFQLQGLPLPITHSDFWFSERRLAVSRNSGTPLDTTMAEASGRRVGEMIEKNTIGTETGVTYGGNSTQVGGYGTGLNADRTSTVYGYVNYPDRLTKTDLTTPTGSNPSSTVADVLEMRQLLYDAHFYGPFMLYHSADWDTYLDNDYFALATTGMAAPTQTLRQRLSAIEGINAVRRLDFLTNTFTLVMVQMTSDVARAVDGMGITTVQWESSGGLRKNFKVMCIQVPQLRSDYSGRCGICHATTS